MVVIRRLQWGKKAYLHYEVVLEGEKKKGGGVMSNGDIPK